jgi:uncharacterized protein (DUF1330 family)
MGGARELNAGSLPGDSVGSAVRTPVVRAGHDRNVIEERAMPAYVVVQITVQDPETYERYKRLAPPSIARYGGQYVIRGGATEILEGSWNPGRFVVLRFPSAAQARAWWSSPEYAEAKALRQMSARTEMLLVEGLSEQQAAARRRR